MTHASKKFNRAWRLPFSYFAALVMRDSIRKKVATFLHGQKDNYYKCLLRLDQAALARMMAELAGAESDDWFKKTLMREGGDSSSSSDSGDDAPPPDPHAGIMVSLGQAPLVDINYVGFLRQRVWAHSPADEVRVVFDQFSGGGGLQRSCCCCIHHDCIRW